ncbi:MAG: hypothetical protein ACOXZ4_05890 [Sphaerochaetaceae bacterium]
MGRVGQLEYLDLVERSSTARSTSYDAASTQLGLAYNNPDANGVYIGDEFSFELNTETPPTIRYSELETDYHLLGKNIISVTPLAVHPCIEERSIGPLQTLMKEQQV